MDTTLAKFGLTELHFDEKSKIAQLDLKTLKRTSEANGIDGQPLRGMYHYQVIDRVADICKKHRLNYAFEEIFAVRNNNKNLPGIIVLPEVEAKYGKNAVEAHIR